MTTVKDILNWLGLDYTSSSLQPQYQYIDFQTITGVAPLVRATPTCMAFYHGGELWREARVMTNAGLILTRLQFARAATRFFPPQPAMVRIDTSQVLFGPSYGSRVASGIVNPLAVIGNEAFAYEIDPVSGEPVRVPQYGGVTLGKEVALGAFTVVDRGTFDDTFIGDYTKIDNLVHVGHNVQIGRRNLIIAGVVFGGSSVVGDDCFIGMNSTIRDHIRIGNHVTIGMGAAVTKDVPSGEVWAGNPARKLR